MMHSVTDLPVSAKEYRDGLAKIEETENKSKAVGQARRSTADKLEIGHYVAGLTEFLLSVETPMVIALQGEWGSGKTSLMNMVHAEMDARTEVSGKKTALFLEFNTWMYSQFNMEHSLIFALFSHFIDSLQSAAGEQKAELSQLAKDIKEGLLLFVSQGLSGAMLGLASEIPFGGVVRPVVKAALSAVSNRKETRKANSADYVEAVERIAHLRKQFEELIEGALKNLETDADDGSEPRIVIFVDDLDRLQPERALELLEAIKIFIGVKHCVFVLAIDYEVVKHGAKAKYGDYLDEVRIHSYFEKIIQFPFRMPLSSYQTKEWLTADLDLAHLSQGKDRSLSDAKDLALSLIDSSVGKNPRALKRLINSYSLLRSIAIKSLNSNSSDSAQLSARKSLGLIGLLCMQFAFPLYYSFFESKVSELTSLEEEDFGFGERILSVSNLDGEDGETSELLSHWGINQMYRNRFLSFLKDFGRIFEDDGRMTSASRGDFTWLFNFASFASANQPSTHDAEYSFVYGLKRVSDRLEGWGVRQELIDLFSKIHHEIVFSLRGGASNTQVMFDVGIGKQREAKMYVLPDRSASRRGTFSETVFRNESLAIRFGATWMPREKLKDMVRELQEAGLTVSDRIDTPNNNFRIEVRQIPADLEEEKMKVLVNCLLNAHNETLKHFDFSSDSLSGSM